MKKASCLAFLGTASGVGKSVLTTAMCRLLADMDVRVAPFKAQNLSNNSGVTPEGLEMGRAQIVQAEACRTAPHVDMNPVLLKPSGKAGSQMVTLGKVLGPEVAQKYDLAKNGLFSLASESLDRLRARYDAVVMEGAGSCAEINLMDRDFINLRMAAYAEAPVVLVADIDKGGVFAQIVGTLECLTSAQKDQVAGFMINRFRGDPRLFDEGVRWLEQKTKKPCFGVIPWFDHIRIEAEDAVVIERPEKAFTGEISQPAVAVIRLPHISNFTDFDPLDATEGISLYFIERPQDLSRFAAVILPGSKNTRTDMAWLRHTGWDEQILQFRHRDGKILGICGGYQMLGRRICDMDGVEGSPGEIEGLGLLPVVTRLAAPKTTSLVRFLWDNIEATGYEIHMGRTDRSGARPWVQVIQQNGKAVDFMDGCVSEDGHVMGTYMHGLFDEPKILSKWLSSIGLADFQVPGAQGFAARDHQYDLLAKHFQDHADIDALMATSGITKGGTH